jgi:hypothetical protein
MKTSAPNDIRRESRQRCALTILEMLVSTAMLTFIVIGLTAVFSQTQRAFKTGIKQTTVTDAGRTILDMIATDMRQMSDAQNIGVTNLYWSWSGNYVQMNELDQRVRTNQLDEIYVLEHINTTWLGVGYAVLNLVPSTGGPDVPFFGTLYRYQTNFNAPFITNNLFWPFLNSVENRNFTNQAYWHRVADGVISLKLRAYDQYGNEPWIESTYYGDYDQSAEISYPFSSNKLPNAVDVELAILEPDALAQARFLTQVPTALNNFMSSNALTKMEVFRRRVSIPVVAR